MAKWMGVLLIATSPKEKGAEYYLFTLIRFRHRREQHEILLKITEEDMILVTVKSPRLVNTCVRVDVSRRFPDSPNRRATRVTYMCDREKS